MRKTKTELLQVRIPEGLAECLHNTAYYSRLSKSEITRLALAHYLTKMAREHERTKDGS